MFCKIFSPILFCWFGSQTITIWFTTSVTGINLFKERTTFGEHATLLVGKYPIRQVLKRFYLSIKYIQKSGHILSVHLDECSQNEDTHITNPQIKTILYPSIIHPFSTLLQCHILHKSISCICHFQFCNRLSSSTKIGLLIFWLERYWTYGLIWDELLTYWHEVFPCINAVLLGDPIHHGPWASLSFLAEYAKNASPWRLLIWAISQGHVCNKGWRSISPQTKSRLASTFHKISGASKLIVPLL